MLLCELNRVGIFDGRRLFGYVHSSTRRRTRKEIQIEGMRRAAISVILADLGGRLVERIAAMQRVGLPLAGI